MGRYVHEDPCVTLRARKEERMQTMPRFWSVYQPHRLMLTASFGSPCVGWSGGVFYTWWSA